MKNLFYSIIFVLLLVGCADVRKDQNIDTTPPTITLLRDNPVDLLKQMKRTSLKN